MRLPRRALLRLALGGSVALGLGFAAGCASGNAPAPRHRSGGERTDTATLARLFPGLPPMSAATWVTGRSGDDRVPGPSLYYLDAVITHAPGVVTDPTDPVATARPTLDGLDHLLPQGEMRTPVALQRRIMQELAHRERDYGVSLTSIGDATLALHSTGDSPFPVD